MKRNIWMFILLFIVPCFAYADSINLNCPSEISLNTEVTCQLIGKSNDSIIALSATIKTSDDLSFVSFIPSNDWQGDGQDGKVDLYRLDGLTNTFNIGTVKLKNTGGLNNTINVNSVFYYNENDKKNSVDSISQQLTVKKNIVDTNNSNDNSNNDTNNNNENSNNNNVDNDDKNNETETIEDDSSAYLVDLKVENYDISFLKEQFEYTLKINNESKLIIIPILEDNNSKYEISGNDNLTNDSVITISVLSKNNKEQKYIIKIEKDKIKKNYDYIFGGIIAILIIINLVRIISRRNKDEER